MLVNVVVLGTFLSNKKDVFKEFSCLNNRKFRFCASLGARLRSRARAGIRLR